MKITLSLISLINVFILKQSEVKVYNFLLFFFKLKLRSIKYTNSHRYQVKKKTIIFNTHSLCGCPNCT